MINKNPSLSAMRKSHLRLPKEQTSMPIEVKAEALVYTRILGHFEMPKSQRWTESRHCWFCENYAYTVILVSKTICQNFYLKPDSNERKICIQKIKRIANK